MNQNKILTDGTDIIDFLKYKSKDY